MSATPTSKLLVLSLGLALVSARLVKCHQRPHLALVGVRPPEVEVDQQLEQVTRRAQETEEEKASQRAAADRWPGLAGYLLAQSGELASSPDPIERRLAELLEVAVPDMRPLRDFGHNSDDITLELAQRAWQLMHQHARLAVDHKLGLVWPVVERALEAANLSSECREAASKTVSAARRLDSWAIQMLSAWGEFPPGGLFEGTFGSIGSFHGCVNAPENEEIGHAHYCTIAYKPVLPSRRNFELIVRQEPEELLHLFERPTSQASDAFTDILKHAQYNHYVYYKLGGCFPIQCSPPDVQRLAKLLGRRSVLMSGPVKCHSKHQADYQADGLQISTRDLNQGLYVWKPHTTRAQLVAGALLGLALAGVLLMTLLDLALGGRAPVAARETAAEAPAEPVEEPHEKIQLDANNNECEPEPLKGVQVAHELHRKAPSSSHNEQQQQRSRLREWASDYSIVNNFGRFFTINRAQMDNDILCINGIRCLTMTWIIVTHTMQYNDWSAFARTREIETHLKSLVNQPIFNASYLVDTFFLISGLLTSFSSFRAPRSSTAADPEGVLLELRRRFSTRSYLLGRYLRLTPQIFFVSLLFIVLPKLSPSGGPHWYTMTGEYSENCAQNWWVNLLHIEAFYRPSQMCNFVCWWVSVDMLFHLFALGVILASLRWGLGQVWRICALLTLLHLGYQAERHFTLALPPNLLSTIPQTGAMWTQMTLGFFWTPQAHALPFFFGLYLGYLMAQRGRALARWFAECSPFGERRRLIGWSLTSLALALQSYSTHFWVTGQWRYTRLEASLFQLLAPAVWSASLGWIILACHYGAGGPLNTILSSKLFLVLGKASYLVYLSHFLILFTFFGSQNLLLEPTQVMMFYVIVGNVCLSMLFGSMLCITFEIPWLKTQRKLVSRFA